jgi:hypothetical protein
VVNGLVNSLKSWRRAASLESGWLTAVFWGVTAVYAGCFLLVELPPLVDYPQHLALATLLGRLFDPGAPEHAAYQADLLTYNGLFHWLVALLSRALPAELSGRIVLALIPVLLAASALKLARYAQRPDWTALLFLPMSYGYATGWGFVNYCLAVPLALMCLVEWLKYIEQPERRAWASAFSALLVAYAHGLTTIALFASAAVAFLARGSLRELGYRRWLFSLLRGLLPLLPAAGYTLLVFAHHVQAPNIGWEPVHEGDDLPAWRKLLDAIWLFQGNLGDSSDTWLFAGLIGVCLGVWAFASAREASGPSALRVCRALFVFWCLAYIVVPQRVFSTGFVFERLPVWIWAFALASLPEVRGRAAVLLRGAGVVLTSLAALNTARAFASLDESSDANAVIDAIPSGSRVVALVYEPRALPAIRRPVFIHAVAYHLVRKGGELAYEFTRFASLPLRMKDQLSRPRLPAGMEWNPSAFDPSAEYADYYDTLFVALDPEHPVDPSAWVLPGGRLRLLSERGRFRSYRREPTLPFGAPGASP